MDHLIGNPSDVVGLELGPGDEPLLPGTLLPMRDVRATDNLPPTVSFPGNGSASGGGGGMIDVGGGGSGTGGGSEGGDGKGSYQPKEVATESGGGAKTDSMRR